MVSTLLSCSEEEESRTHTVSRRTVIVYIVGENNLTYNAIDNLRDMAAGSVSLAHDVNLVAFVDMAESTSPYVVRIMNGEKSKDEAYQRTEDFYSTDPEEMYATLKWIVERYPANEYGLILWGHSTSWLIRNDTIAITDGSVLKKRAYGYDTGYNQAGGNGKWINIPTLAKVLAQLPRMKFIMGDCCCFQSVETAYELREVCDYLIGSPAEIPSAGAPYRSLVPLLFSEADNFYVPIADAVNEYMVNGLYTPVSVIRTSALEQLGRATASVWDELYADGDPITDNRIYYYGNDLSSESRVLYDMNDIMMNHLSPDSYTEWKQSFDQAVVYRRHATQWNTAMIGGRYLVDFDFEVDEENYGGMSMFLPLNRYSKIGLNYNSTFRQMSWSSVMPD